MRRGAGEADGPWFGGDVAGNPGCGIASTVPARMTFGLGPITGRLAAYRARHPPGVARAAAMPDRVSPAATVYRAGAA